jgi:transcriptional regulator with XRE-family HTH domain
MDDMAERLLIFGAKLAGLRAERYLTQEEFADRLGMSTAGVRRLEQLKVSGMQMRNFRRLAEMVQLTPQELRQRIGSSAGQSADAGRSRLVDGQPMALARESARPVVEIERFHGVSAARPEDRACVQRGCVPVPAGPGRRFAAVVDGDCMQPQYHHGDVVVFSIDAAEKEGIIEGRNYFVQFADGENTFKRIFFDPENSDRLVLRCWNPKYPQRRVERSRVQLLARAEFRLVPDDY